MHFRLLIFWAIYWVLPTEIIGQVVNNHPLKIKQILVSSCTVALDEKTIIPNNVLITNGNDTIKAFEISNNVIVFDQNVCGSLLNKSISVKYRTFTFDINRPYYVVDSTALEFKERPLITGYEYRPNDNKNALIESKGLDYKGSFSRGLSVGNSQSLVLNSNFDMQLIGDLGNGLKVVAAISDENLPIQAQGNTQQLQEFDKVFIQVSKDKTSIIAGDYELRKPNSYFMNYFKKLKGVSLSSTINTTKSTEVYSKGSFAISRGKFARQPLVTAEGNQGPYRLQGNNGERFIIVLAGTEKVFYNGILLKRGFDYDYIIDYNRAEITFSPTRVIARDSRVIVDFEYTDISYLRSLYATETEYRGRNWNVNFNFYSEQDSKNSTGDVQLDSTDLNILQLSGDDPTRSVRRSLRVLSEAEKLESARILYIGEPNPLDPTDIILRFTESVDSAQYTAVFSEVGQGRGDYVIDNTKNKNARVYRYVGDNMGSYLPVVQLIPPEQKQLFTLNGSYKFSQESDVFAEVAMSNLDKNRLSTINNDDNVGFSSHIALNHVIKLDSIGNWKVRANVKHEFVQRDFNALNPFRVPEFTRDWNIGQLTSKGDENLLFTTLSLGNKSGFNVDYGFNHFGKSDVYNGNKHQGTIKYDKGRISFKAFTNYLTSESSALNQNTTFIRPNIVAQYKLDKNSNWSIGGEYDAESNQLRGNISDTLQSRSYSFSNLKLFITNDFTKDFALKFSYAERNDFFAKQNSLQQAANAKEIEIAGKWLASKNSDLQWSLIGRDLNVTDPSLLPNDSSKKTILGRMDYTFAAINSGIKSTTSYNTNSGQEPKIEYIFQKVEVGQGDYFLITESENPNLSNIQDFRYDPTNPLSNYIRLTLTNNEFIRTNNIELNQNLTIDPSKFKVYKEGVKKSKFYRFVSRFSTLSNYRITKKQMDGADSPLSSYVDFSLGDTSLVAYNSLNANTLFFNRGNVKYDIQVGNRNNQNRIIQVSGREDRGLNDYFLRSRWNLWNKLDMFFILEKSEKSYQSEAFGDRNLAIDIYRVKPEISLRPSTNTRINIKYNYEDKQQKILSKDNAFVNEFTSEFSLRKASKYSFDCTVSYVNIKFSGKANSPIEYDLLDGLKNGRNYIWNIIYTKRMAKNIDLTINYEGRKTGISPLVNVGRAQIKATF